MIDTQQMDEAGGSVVEYLGHPLPLLHYLQLLLLVGVRRMSKKKITESLLMRSGLQAGEVGRAERKIVCVVEYHYMELCMREMRLAR